MRSVVSEDRSEGMTKKEDLPGFRDDESRRILFLRRRALLMELALIEDELGIERSVKRK